jgi:ABC-2 type transport system ATP-binding protein
MAVIEVTDLRCRYGDHVAVGGIDFTVERGEVFALLGANGAGKTTTVRILTTLLAPDGGTARVAGHDVTRAPNEVRAAISLTAQEAAVDGMLTGAENLRMMARLRGVKKTVADELLERFDLVDAADRRVEKYSGGMRRRLDLAMSLVVRPQVLFLDEPTTGLDPRSRRAVWDAVTTLADEGVTVLLTTQYLEEADRLAQRIAVIDGGRVIEEGTAQELKSRLANEVLAIHFAGKPTVRVPVNDPDDVRRALEEHPDAERIELHQPSLDDVFLAVTR